MRRMPLRPAFMHSQVVRPSWPSAVTERMPATPPRRSPRSAKPCGPERSAIGLAAGRSWRSPGDRLVPGNDEGERGLDCHLAVDAGHRARLAEEPAQLLDGHLDAQGVPWRHGPTEAAVVDAREQGELAAVLGKLEHGHRPSLGHRLDHQDPGHDWTPGEVSGELWLVRGHRLDRDHALALLELEDAVDQEERIPMRDDPHDLRRLPGEWRVVELSAHLDPGRFGSSLRGFIRLWAPF